MPLGKTKNKKTLEPYGLTIGSVIALPLMPGNLAATPFWTILGGKGGRGRLLAVNYFSSLKKGTRTVNSVRINPLPIF